MDLLLLFVPIITDVTDAHHGVVHDFFFEGKIPVLHSAIGVIGIEQADIETSREQSRVICVDDRIGCIDSGDVLRRRAQAQVRQPVRGERRAGDTVREARSYRN